MHYAKLSDAGIVMVLDVGSHSRAAVLLSSVTGLSIAIDVVTLCIPAHLSIIIQACAQWSLPYSHLQLPVMKKGLPRGAPTPRRSLEELLEEAFERKRRREAKRENDAEVGGQCSALGRSPGDMSGQGTSLGRSILALGKDEHGTSAEALGSVGVASSSPASSSSNVLMKATPKQRALVPDSGSQGSASIGLDEGMVILKPKAHAKVVGKRADVPQLNYTRRGDKKKALAVASDPGLLQEAMESYDQAVQSSNDTSDYYVKPWT